MTEATPTQSPVDNKTWPGELRFQRDAKQLVISFLDGAAFTIPFELLRVESPSAEVQGHGPSGKVLVVGKGDVGVRDAQRVGQYGVRIVFDDGHDTGLFTWTYLRALGEQAQEKLAAYRAAAEGLANAKTDTG